MKTLPFSKNRSFSRHYQKGDFLIESLIGVLLIGIVGVGIAHTAGRVTDVQIQNQQQSEVLTTLQGVASKGVRNQICGDVTLHNGSYNSDKVCDGIHVKTSAITFDNKEITINRPLVMEANISVDDVNTYAVQIGQVSY